MTRELITTAIRLADVLARENAALQGLEITRACALLAEKTAAMEAFVAAQLNLNALSGLDRYELEALASRLRKLAAENKTLLERNITVQRRVIGIVAQAGRSALTRSAPRYGAKGRPAEASPMALALSARA
jgi:hypothetical protein